MRFVIAAVLFIVSTVLILLGIGQRTVWAPPSQYSASIALTEKAPYVVVPNQVLKLHPGIPKITTKQAGVNFIATGRESDITAFIADANHIALQVDKKSQKITEAAKVGYGVSVSPMNSDLWRVEKSENSSVSLGVNSYKEGAALIASDGVANAPTQIDILWQVANDLTVSNWLIWVGLALLLISAVLTLLTFRRMRINRGPRRKIPKAPKPPKYRYRSTITAPKRGRRAARGFVAVTSGGLVLSMLTGCVSANPTASPTTSPTSASTDQSALMPSQIRRIVADVASIAEAADAANDKRILADRFAGPALQVRAVNYQIRIINKRIASLPPIVGQPIRFSLPTVAGKWPRTLMVVTDEQGETALPQMLVLQQDNPRAKYQVWFTSRLMPGAEIPAAPSTETGAIPIDPSSLFLKIQPKNLATTFGDVLNNGPASNSAPLFDLNNEFFKQVYESQKAQETSLNKANITFTHQLGDQNVISLATLDGGALVAVYQSDIYTIKPTKANSAVGVTGQEKILLGANGATRGVRSTYGDMLLFYVPAIDEKGKIKLLGATQGLVSVRSL